jgi:predicted glycoside hydrolase/deacetylase ChbG (UPF0249 family)
MTYHITCDDCGMYESINTATLELFQAGMAHSASIVTNFPAAQHAFELFAPHPSLKIGSHLNLTEGMALTGVSPLTDKTGKFRWLVNVAWQGLWESDDFLQAAEVEFKAQIEVLVKAGIQVEHITSHMHFHIIPALREIILGLARDYKVRWIRAYQARNTILPANPFVSLPQNHDTRTLDYLAPIMYWRGESKQKLADALHPLQGTVEIVVHPALPNTTLPSKFTYSAEGRYQEVEYLRKLWMLLNQGI